MLFLSWDPKAFNMTMRSVLKIVSKILGVHTNENLQSCVDSQRNLWFKKCWMKHNSLLALKPINDPRFTFFKNPGLNSNKPTWIIFPSTVVFFSAYLRNVLLLCLSLIYHSFHESTCSNWVEKKCSYTAFHMLLNQPKGFLHILLNVTL